MIFARNSGGIDPHEAISRRERRHPVQSPLAGSSTQTLMQGVSMGRQPADMAKT
jgi:hypothetical protein